MIGIINQGLSGMNLCVTILAFKLRRLWLGIYLNNLLPTREQPNSVSNPRS
jgi:hypothetical protein